jgi:hypothetical protein
LPVEAQSPESSTLEVAVGETTLSALPGVVSESSAQGFGAVPGTTADSAPVHVSAATVRGAGNSLPFATVGTLGTAPIPGLVFQFGNVPAVATPGAGIGLEQHLADQWFQVLARATTSPLDPTQLVGTIGETFERVLANPRRLSPSTGDTFDGLNWDEVSSDLDGQGTEIASALLGRLGRRDTRGANQVAPFATAQRFTADYASLDQYFAQAADDAVSTAPEE